MNKIKFFIFAVLLSACQQQKSSETVAEVTDLTRDIKEGWNTIESIDGTCSDGSIYSFFYRPGNPEKLAIFLQGGGATWNYFNAVEQQSFKDVVDLERPQDDPVKWGGVFDFNNNLNPLLDYSMLVVPYCTGDVLIGNISVEYVDNNSDSTIVIRHNGYNNTMDAIDWLSGAHTNPKEIFLFGTSAGSVATPVYAAVLASQYPSSRLLAFGDSSGAYASDSTARLLENWNAIEVLQLVLDQPVEPEGLGLNELYSLTAAKYPSIEFLTYNSTMDNVQAYFLSLLGEDPRGVSSNIRNQMKQLDSNIPHFNYYIDTGKHHGIFQSNKFYSTTANKDIALRDWLANYLKDSSTAENVNCCGE